MNSESLWPPDDPPDQGLGLMRLRDPEPGAASDGDRDPVAVVHAAIDAGVILLDTAEMYGNEELVGRTVRGRRDEVLLCSKFGVRWGDSGRFDDWSVHADAATVVSSCERSLRRLDVDVIDLYYLHHRSEITPIEETITAMADLVAAGKIRAIGLSNVTADDVRRAHAVHRVAALQEHWSLGDRGVEALVPTAAERGIALIAHSPLGHGELADSQGTSVATALADVASTRGVTPGQVALAWVHHQGQRHGLTVVPLPGTTSVRHLHANVAAGALVLTPEELVRLNEISAEPVEPTRR